MNTNLSPIAPGPTTLATPCPSWCNRKHPLDEDTDARIHSGTITTEGIVVTVEQLETEDGHRLHVDERDYEGGMTPAEAFTLSHALVIAAFTALQGQR